MVQDHHLFAVAELAAVADGPAPGGNHRVAASAIAYVNASVEVEARSELWFRRNAGATEGLVTR
jgi:hypothetical protein